jgi:radical SAM protein with 4Fe4S-binding SPASM domain
MIITGGAEIIKNCNDPWFKAMVYPEELVEYVKQKKTYCLMAEITSFCAGSCAYCFSSSDRSKSDFLSKETIFEIIDFAESIGAKQFAFTGGDALAHPDWEEIISYAREKGMGSGIGCSWIISKQMAKKIVELEVKWICGHIDTIDPQAYAEVHTDPKTLDLKIRGLYNLLEAGFPKEGLITLITVTKPILKTLEKTIDWYIDEIGLYQVGLLSLKGVGYGNLHREWEPSLEEFRQIHEYRAKRMGEHWLHMGVGDAGKYLCKGHFIVHCNGDVSPCNTLRELAVGNIFKEDLRDIYNRHKDFLLLDYEIKGPCGDCENNEICFGCRANAYYYTGDVQNSDPKCWWNPQSKQHYYAEAGR